eukprot:jgi/Ulvmu1/6888/UM031_0094.1
MTAIDVAARPAVAEVQRRLLAINADLLAQNETPHFIAPFCHITPAHACSPSPRPGQPAPQAAQIPACRGSQPSAAQLAVGVPVEAPAGVQLGVPVQGYAAVPAGVPAGAPPAVDLISLHDEGDGGHGSKPGGMPQVAGSPFGRPHGHVDAQQHLLPPWECAHSLALHSEPQSLMDAPMPAAGSLRQDSEAAAPLSLQVAGMHVQLPEAAVTAHTTHSSNTAPDSACLTAAMGPEGSDRLQEGRCRVMATAEIATVEELFGQVALGQPGRDFLLNKTDLVLTSSWPTAEAASLLRAMLRGGADADFESSWMQRCGIGAMKNTALLATGAATIASATVHLGSVGCICFCQASNTVLCDMTIEGGILVCHGCSVTLNNVVLTDCQLIVLGGAHVTAEDLQVHFSGLDDVSAVIVSGVRSSMHATQLHITAWAGLSVEAGASFTGKRVRVKGRGMRAVSASGVQSTLSLSESHVECTVAATAASACVGVVAETNAKLSMSDCTVAGFVESVRVAGDAAAVLNKCVLKPLQCAHYSACSRAGVRVCDGRVEWRGGSVVWDARTLWIRVEGHGLRAQAKLGCKMGPRKNVEVDTRSTAAKSVCLVDGTSIW